jgi:phosphoglycolate phosphatase
MSIRFDVPGDRCGWPGCMLFDLDGTLIDSAPDIAAAVNELLAQDGLGPLTVQQVRAMIGRGVPVLVERAYAACGLPLAGQALGDAANRMSSIYARHLTNLTVLMPGALETVAAFAKAGVRVAVVSNKPNAFTREILDRYGLSPHLAATQGAEEGLARKPAPDMLLAAIAKAGSQPSRTLMIGDSEADVQSARAAHIPVVIVRGGYTTTAPEKLGADLVISALGELPNAIERLKEPA